MVVSREGRLTGVVSLRDLVMDDVKRRPHVPVEDVVRSKTVFTVPLGTSLYTCAEQMLAEGVGSLPLVKGDRAVGIVTRRDLLEAVANALETERLFGESRPDSLRPEVGDVERGDQ
jgi:CBS domain-containing protein